MRLLDVATIVAACGGSAEAPATASVVPFGVESAEFEIHFASLFDTTLTMLQPRNLYGRVSVPAVDIGIRYCSTLLTTNEPAATVALDETGEGGKPLAIQFQVFAYDGDELLGDSDVWAIEVKP